MKTFNDTQNPEQPGNDQRALNAEPGLPDAPETGAPQAMAAQDGQGQKFRIDVSAIPSHMRRARRWLVYKDLSKNK